MFYLILEPNISTKAYATASGLQHRNSEIIIINIPEIEQSTPNFYNNLRLKFLLNIENHDYLGTI